MAFNALERLKNKDIDFLFDLPIGDIAKLINYIRESEDKKLIIDNIYSKLVNIDSSFCFKIIYDMDEYNEEFVKLLPDELTTEQIENIFENTKTIKDYLINCFDKIINNDEKINIVCEKSIQNNDEKYIAFLSKHNNLHIRAQFMKCLIKNKPDLINQIYGNIIKYLTNITYEINEQLSFFDELMKQEDLCEIAVLLLDTNRDKDNFYKLKEIVLTKYYLNDLAKIIIMNENKDAYLMEDLDKLFETSKNYQLQIFKKYKELLSNDIYNDFDLFLKNFGTNNQALFTVFSYGLGHKLRQLINKYLEKSENKEISYIGKGTTSTCFKIGDYVVKLVIAKWSYEEVICPRLYLINKNYEEIYIRGQWGDVLAGIEIQKYLKKSAKDLPLEALTQFRDDLRGLGYYLNEMLISETRGENCKLLDTYLDADTDNLDEIPEHFKKHPLVLIDHDRIYKTENIRPKQLYGKY